MLNIGTIPNGRQDCFIAATLQELAYFECYSGMLTAKLEQRQGENFESYQSRCELQDKIVKIVEKLRLGHAVSSRSVKDFRTTLVKIGLLPRLSTFEIVLSRLFPFLFPYESGDLFELYNTIVEKLDCQDYLVPSKVYSEIGFYDSFEAEMKPEYPLLHYFAKNKSDIVTQLSPRVVEVLSAVKNPTLKVNVSKLKNKKGEADDPLPFEIVLEGTGKRRVFDARFIQCTVPVKFLGFNTSYHSFVYLKKGEHWYQVDGVRIQQVSVATIQKVTQKGIFHLDYVPKSVEESA